MVDASIVVMGVSGSGKSTIGTLLAEALGLGFIDADDLHPAANKDKMAHGIPLTDEDRWPWLGAVGDATALAPCVCACSALKRAYRDALRAKDPGVVFVELDGSRELLAERMGAREGHFMPTSLLDSQLATLEPLQADEAGFRVGIDATGSEIVAAIVERLRGQTTGG
ncbi:MAG: gntK [Rhodoglobus sp.]|nr:gntK [Rhodoglobus sp.]